MASGAITRLIISMQMLAVSNPTDAVVVDVGSGFGRVSVDGLSRSLTP